MTSLLAAFRATWAELAPIGRRPDGGYDRFSWTDADAQMRAWFRRAAAERDLVVEQDRNGNLWAWWGHDPHEGPPPEGALATGSHLDSVPGGGAYDGPLGVVAGFLAIDVLRERSGAPRRPLAAVCFTEEEGGRFGVACLGSQLSVGALDPDRARALADRAEVTLAGAMRASGAEPDALGRDDDRLSRLGAFVELHVEQGRFLADAAAPVGVASGMWPHGRWRLRFEGEANHAGTTHLRQRKDPLLPFATTVLAAREVAATRHGLATVGRASLQPNATNAVAASVDAWLDARAPDDTTLDEIVEEVRTRAEAAAAAHGVACSVTVESRTAAVSFDAGLRMGIVGTLGGGVPEMSTGAGHDAGVLAAKLPTAMVFVRNPTGVSHSPKERASDGDCVEGVQALARILEELAWR